MVDHNGPNGEQLRAHHKQLFFAEKGEDGAAIDYIAAVAGDLLLVPQGAARDALAEDYASMIADGLIHGEAPSFEAMMDQCAAIAARANAAAAATKDGV